MAKNKPKNAQLWAMVVRQAKDKFDVYPSAYANGWAVQQYNKLMKKRGAKAPYWESKSDGKK